MIGRRGFLGSLIALATTPALGLPKPKFAITSAGTVKGVFIKKPPDDAFIPEKWAQESLKILEENMVIANIIHRDRDFV